MQLVRLTIGSSIHCPASTANFFDFAPDMHTSARSVHHGTGCYTVCMSDHEQTWVKHTWSLRATAVELPQRFTDLCYDEAYVLHFITLGEG